MNRILIIEDEPLVARMYQKTLKFDGFDVVSAIGGEEGIQKAKQYKPSLILLDIMMPQIDGMQVLSKLKADPATSGIPVVVLTNLSGKQDAKYAVSKGAADYWIKKEVKSEELGKKVRTVLQTKSAATQQ